MGTKVLWLAAVVALFTVGVVGATGPPAIAQPAIAVAVDMQYSHQVLALEASREVILISSVDWPEHGCLEDSILAAQPALQVISPATIWRTNEKGVAIPALIVRSAIYDQAIFAREPVPYWLRV